MRKILVGTATVAAMLVVSGIGTSVAGADTAQSFRTITYGNTPPNHRLVVASGGPIVGAGTETLLNPAPNGTAFLEWSFPAGDVFVTLNATQDFQGPPVPPGCEATATISGTYVITGGTGAYAGVSGSGTVTGTGRVFAVFDPATGQCSMDQANLFLSRKTYTGTVSLP
jgi:hypothetical protein